MNIAMVDVPGCVICLYCIRIRTLYGYYGYIYTYRRGASALLVQTTVGNAKASKRGTSDDTSSRAFFICICEEESYHKNVQLGESSRTET